ncbi:hypothetical protein Sjap_006403 [Stephania japonica]|uniref:U3 small nucleolar RNA-associated protein 18 homolog n=1 Tax=Stephania japonica TaxID=461633 RepID=A0AAP0PLY3_9MAGN
MSLISQKLLQQKQVQKVKEDEVGEILRLEENNEVNGIINEVDASGGFVKSKKRKKERNGENKEVVMKEEAEMKRLEGFLFGSLYSPLEFGKEDRDVEDGGSKSAVLFFSERSPGIGEVELHEDMEGIEEMSGLVNARENKPAWVDEEEEKVRVDIAKVRRLRKLRKEDNESSISGLDYVSRLRAQHVKLNPWTDWARVGSQDWVDEESEEEDGVVTTEMDKDREDLDSILRSNEEFIAKSSVKLLPGILEYSKLVDANVEELSSGPVNSVQFHRNSQLLLAAGLDRRLRFFQIDGKRNTKIQSIFLEDCPIRKASFLPDGSQVIAAGRRKFFYTFDLVKAKFEKIGPLIGREEKSLETFEVSPDSSTIAFVGSEGYILLVSCRTKELMGTLKMNGSARALAFSNDGRQLLSSGGDGHVYHWDLRTRTCFHKAVDEGCITGSAICTSADGALFAAGSTSGIVNIYNNEMFLGGKKKPLKTIENLTTSVDFMKFNHDSQILAICSRMQKNSLKFVHVPTFSVFSNWPPPNRTLHHPRCLDFSPGGGFMAMGNAAGKVLLYKLHHYQHA